MQYLGLVVGYPLQGDIEVVLNKEKVPCELQPLTESATTFRQAYGKPAIRVALDCYKSNHYAYYISKP
jgi:hypothetical protein